MTFPLPVLAVLTPVSGRDMLKGVLGAILTALHCIALYCIVVHRSLIAPGSTNTHTFGLYGHGAAHGFSGAAGRLSYEGVEGKHLLSHHMLIYMSTAGQSVVHYHSQSVYTTNS